MGTPFRPPVPKPVSRRAQTNTAGVTSKDRTSLGPRPDGSSPGEPPADTSGVVPVGGIIMWSGAFASLPDNWHLCDGTDGTPNLTDRFILGTNTEGELATIGGTKKHRHNLIAADTPAGTATVVAITAGTPAGSISSVSGGTPAGTIGDHDVATLGLSVGGDTDVLVPPAMGDQHTFTGSALAGHSHTFTGSALATHTHLLAGKTALGESDAGTPLYGANDTLPPFYKLAFIQRLS